MCMYTSVLTVAPTSTTTRAAPALPSGVFPALSPLYAISHMPSETRSVPVKDPIVSLPASVTLSLPQPTFLISV